MTFTATQIELPVIAAGVVVEHDSWPGYLWEIMGTVIGGRTLDWDASSNKLDVNYSVRLNLLLPPDRVPWQNAPETIRGPKILLTATNAMEVMARVASRDDSKGAVNKRKSAYKKILRQIKRYQRLVERSKRPQVKNRARLRLDWINRNYPELSSARQWKMI